MDDPARDPEAMLARLRTEEPQTLGDRISKRGQLKIFFGYAAGVGKTYTMLEAARGAVISGHEVLLGYIEPHGRPETEALLLGHEMLPLRELEYRGVKLKEFDLDAALARKPEILLVDELAHTNAAGSRHNRRWQDVQELLEAGINVWSTLNVQHVESLNDIVAQITGIVVRETVPDHVFDEATEVELVDLPPDELLERFREGKVYMPEQAERAADRFFRKANLIALREIAMRRVADRVGIQVQTARLGQTRTQIWPTRERLLVCVGPSPTSAKVIRSAKRLAAALRAEWIAVYTETPASQQWDPTTRQRMAAHLKLAEQLGAETVTLTGQDVAEEVVRYAQSRNVTKIVIGKTGEKPGAAVPWRFWRRSIVDRLVAQSGDIDVYIIRGVEERVPAPAMPEPARRPVRWADFGLAAIVLLVATLVAQGFHAIGLSDTNAVMTYLLGVVVVGAWLGRGPAIATSLAAVLLFNFFFTEPYYTFVVDDTQYIYTFAIMLLIALVVSALTVRIRDQVGLSREREHRTEALYRVSHRLAATTGRLQLIAAAQEQFAAILGGQVVVFVPEDGILRPPAARGTDFAQRPAEREVARWVFEHRQLAGRSSDTLPSAAALYLPLVGPDTTVGVIAWCPHKDDDLLRLERRQLLDAFATQIALALERDRLAHEAQRVLAEAEAERLRSSLLSAVSHDLRTPLAAIAGSASTLVESNLDDATRRELARTIYEETDRLSRLVENLLHLTRIESGAMNVDKQWQPLDEVVGSALHRMESAMAHHDVRVDLSADLPLVPLDGLLIEQVLVNLLDNAAKYTPASTAIDITARSIPQAVEVTVADRGPGLNETERQRVFEKFYRSSGVRSDRGRGAGLGLAICRAIVTAHGGRIWADAHEGGGTCFRFTLPIEAAPPVIDQTAPQEAHA